MGRDSTNENTDNSAVKVFLTQALLAGAFIVMVVVFMIVLLSRFS